MHCYACTRARMCALPSGKRIHLIASEYRAAPTISARMRVVAYNRILTRVTLAIKNRNSRMHAQTCVHPPTMQRQCSYTP
jgi:hypothetical protein